MGLTYSWESKWWVCVSAPWGQVCRGGYSQLHVTLLKLHGPSWHTGMSSLRFRVGQEEHVTLVMMSANSEAAKESSKPRPEEASRAFTMQVLEISSLPEVPAATPWMEGHNWWKQLITNSVTAKGLQPSLSSLDNLSHHERKGATRENHTWRHSSWFRERIVLPFSLQNALGALSLSSSLKPWCLYSSAAPLGSEKGSQAQHSRGGSSVCDTGHWRKGVSQE